MRMWTKSACVMGAWIVLLLLTASGLAGSAAAAQATTRTVNTIGNTISTRSSSFSSSTTSVVRNGSGQTALIGAPASPRLAAVSRLAPTETRYPSATRYVVRPGDTLVGIAAALAVPGGWPALYAANRATIGPDPGLIYPGAVLALPGRAATTRYAVAAGDTLAGIAAALAVPGGWPALYAANRATIGPDPGLIRTGMVLTVPRATVPHPARPGRPAVRPAPPRHQVRPAAPEPHGRPQPRPGTRTAAPAARQAGMPGWLKLVLLAAALLIIAALLAPLVLAASRRRDRADRPARILATQPTGPDSGRSQPQDPPLGPGTPGPRTAADPTTGTTGHRPQHDPPITAGQGPSARPRQASIILTDHGRLVVTHCTTDNTVYVLRPPGTDSAAILRLARLVLAEDPYRDLARYLGLPATWPIILADYPRVVVTRSKADDTVFVLRPPGEDPKAVLRAARLILPEDNYEELASHLGIAANWPME